MLPTPQLNGERLDFQEDRKERDAVVSTGASWPSPAPAMASPGVAEAAEQVRKEIAAMPAHRAEHAQHAQHRPEPSAGAGEAPTTLAEAWDLETNLLLEEFSAMDNAELVVPLNVRMTATEAVSLRKDDQEFALRARRPIPLEPKPYAKRGTAFHNWVEERYKQVSLLDEDQLPGASDATLELSLIHI